MSVLGNRGWQLEKQGDGIKFDRDSVRCGKKAAIMSRNFWKKEETRLRLCKKKLQYY